MNTRLNHFNQALKRNGKLCVVNNITTITAIIREKDDNVKSIDTKCLITGYNANQGDIINFNNSNYIVVTKENMVNDVYSTYTIRKAPYLIKYILGNNLKTIYMYVDTKIFDVTTGTFFNSADGEIYITMPNNLETSNIKLQDRFIKFRSPWEVIAINNTLEGLIVLTAKVDLIKDGDDMTNEIPAGYHNYSYTLDVSPSTITADAGKTQQITATVKDGGTTVTNATFTYESDNTSIATVDSTGVVTGVAAGNCNITVSFSGLDDQTYTQSIPTTIATPASVSYTLVGSSTIETGTQGTYSVQNADGSTPTGVIFTFTYTNTHVTIVSQTDTSVTLNGASAGQTKLTATEGENSCYKIISVQTGF